MRTFEEVGKTARAWENTQAPGTLNVLGMIAELAEGMARLEYNTALQMSRLHLRGLEDADITVEEFTERWLANLRADLPQ